MNPIDNFRGFIWDMLEGPDGVSSKRVFSLIILVASIVYIFTNQNPNPSIIYSMFGTITLLLGVGALMNR